MYPWHQRQWAQLTTAIAKGRLSHALLLQGPEGLGKWSFANELAEFLLCTNHGGRAAACGACRACTLTRASTHPDLITLTPEEEKKDISVDQVRSLGVALSLTSHAGGWKVAVIVPAETMNKHAANALLKTLEEPGPNTILILITTTASRLPATLRSRCQRIRFSIPPAKDAVAWLESREQRPDWPRLLQFSGGAPLTAIDLAEHGFAELDQAWRQDLNNILRGGAEPVEIAERWGKTEPGLCVVWLRHQTMDLIRSRWSENQFSDSDTGHTLSLQIKGKEPSLDSLFGYLDQLDLGMRLLNSNANRQLLMESLLIPWAYGLRAA